MYVRKPKENMLHSLMKKVYIYDMSSNVVEGFSTNVNERQLFLIQSFPHFVRFFFVRHSNSVWLCKIIGHGVMERFKNICVNKKDKLIG